MYFARGFSKQRLMVLIVLLLALTILMPIYANMEHYEGVNLYATYIVAIVTGIMFIIVTISLFLKQKHNY